jgi:hypothetical protein
MHASNAARRLSRTVLLTALVLVTLHVAQLGHLLFARHGICPEHGEMIELGAVGHAEAVAQAPGPSDALSEDASSAAEHVHCPVLYGRRDVLAAAPPVVRVLALYPPPSDLDTPSIWPPDFSGRLELAPKHSPPAA